MYFWDLKGLTEHLTLEKNTETEGFHYLFAGGLLSGFPLAELIVFTKEKNVPERHLLPTLVGFAVGAVILYFILGALFRANGAARGRHFLHRAFAVSWVVGLRYLAMFIPAAVGIQFISKVGSAEVNVVGLIVFTVLIVGCGIFAFTVELATLRKIHQACDLKTPSDEGVD